MRRMGFVCVVVGLVAACAGGAEGGSEPDPVLKGAAGALRSALGGLGAAVSFEYPEHLASLTVRYRTRTFMVHGGSKRGAYTKEAREQEGPRYDGFLLRVHLQEAGAVHQAMVPQTIRGPYWQTDLDVTVVPGTGKQLYWALAYGSSSDQGALQNVRAALRGLGEPDVGQSNAVTEVVGGDSESRRLLRSVDAALRAAVRGLGSEVSFAYGERSPTLMLRYRTRRFVVHGPMKGGYEEETRREEGPQWDGFMLSLRVEKAGTVYQAMVPQTMRRPYWDTELDVLVVPGTGKQLSWALSYQPRPERDVLRKIRAALWGQSESAAGQADEWKSTLVAGGLMLRPVKWEKEVNKRRLEGAIREAKRKGAELIVTLEGALEGYVVNEVIRATGAERQVLTENFNALAEPVGGPYIKHFRRLCKELKVHLILGFLERDGGKMYNTAVLIRPDGRVAGKYRKTHFAQGYSNEDEKGDNPPGYLRGAEYPVFEIAGRKMGIMICYDRQKPIVAKRLVENGAEFIINPAYGMMGDCNCEFLSSRGKETGVPILFVHPEQTVETDERGKVRLDLRPKEDEGRIVIMSMEIPKKH